MKYICLLGRQPELSLAELECRFGSSSVRPFGDSAAIVEAPSFDIQTIGGTFKAGQVIAELPTTDWAELSRDVVHHFAHDHDSGDGKLTLGISVYGRDIAPRDVQRTGLAVKQTLKKSGRSVRLIPNDAAALSTATSHHNKLGLSPNKAELVVVYGPGSVIVASSVGTQNITALARRDQARPKTDAFVGMLPPKLALMMINLSGITRVASQASSGLDDPDVDTLQTSERVTILDPFCGTGVVLQEAALLGFNVYGTDLSDKMVDYSTANLQWLSKKHRIGTVRIEQGDATNHSWQQPIAAVVAETYLGQPFSAPPAPDKLVQVKRNVNHIVSDFLTNLHPQLQPGTPLCLAVPAWRDARGQMTHLPLLTTLHKLGYERRQLTCVDSTKLVYYREDQIVARQLLLLTRN